jgi:uncharacterized OsmC-like protein
VHGFRGLDEETSHRAPFVLDADQPTALAGDDTGPAPLELLLHALAACLTAGIANAAARLGIQLTSLETTLEGDLDARGLLGLPGGARNGYGDVRARVVVDGDDVEALQAIVEQACARSPVFDVLAHGVPITLDVDTA